MAMSKWIVETNGRRVRRLGKTGEELGEASSVVNRCIIQGIDEIDPSSGKTNRRRLEEELADVWAQIECTIEEFGLDVVFMSKRIQTKKAHMAEWEALVEGK